MLENYFPTPAHTAASMFSSSRGSGGNMELTLAAVKVEEEEGGEETVDGVRRMLTGGGGGWFDLIQSSSSVNSSWDSGVVLDTNTVVQMAEFQEIIDSLQKCAAGGSCGETLPLPPPYTTATANPVLNGNCNSNHNYHNNTNNTSFHSVQQQQPASSPSPITPPTFVLPPSTTPSPTPINGGTAPSRFLFHDSELEQLLLQPGPPHPRVGAASYHAGECSGNDSLLRVNLARRLTCQSLPSLTAGATASVAAVAERTGEQNCAVHLRWGAARLLRILEID